MLIINKLEIIRKVKLLATLETVLYLWVETVLYLWVETVLYLWVETVLYLWVETVLYLWVETVLYLWVETEKHHENCSVGSAEEGAALPTATYPRSMYVPIQFTFPQTRECFGSVFM